MAEPFIGQIVLFAGPYYPDGWAPCFGQVLSIGQYPALFGILGSTYGGDGTTTFQLPDLRGRAPIGTGQVGSSSNIDSGDTGGNSSVLLTLGNLPPHNHPLNVSSANATSSNPQAGYLAPAVDNNGGVPNFVYGANPGAAANPGAIGSVGGATPVPTMPPYIGMNYIIALTGSFPASSTLYPATFKPSPAPDPGPNIQPNLTV